MRQRLPVDSRQRAKDFIALTKPIVVTLLLSTTFGGMVIAAGKMPAGNLLFWTLLGGGLAAGGSSALNQYIDRSLDAKMNRTANRPIPAGRLTPAEGLAFGSGALVIAFYLLAGFVNMLAALLSLAGMVYYVILYSLFLKNRNEQNIVIGGGAGAIPAVGRMGCSNRHAGHHCRVPFPDRFPVDSPPLLGIGAAAQGRLRPRRRADDACDPRRARHPGANVHLHPDFGGRFPAALVVGRSRLGLPDRCSRSSAPT